MRTRFTKRDTAILVFLGTVILAASGSLAYALFYSGSVSSSVNVTSTTTSTSTTVAAPVLAITAATASGGGFCVVDNANSATCTGSTIGQGGSYTVSVTVSNTGNQDASVSVSGSSPGLSGASFALDPSTPSPQTVAQGGSVTWSFSYTAGQTTGSDSVTVSISA